MDKDVGRRGIDMMRSLGVEIDTGLTPAELDAVERSFGFVFAPEHRALLAAGLPVGPERFPDGQYPDWPRWRDGLDETIRRRLAAPVDWLLPDDGGPMDWWHSSWGNRPTDPYDAVDVARAGLLRWPPLVPIYGHRFIPAAPAPSPAPVLSVHGSDIIYYGSSLLTYIVAEFDARYVRPVDDHPEPVHPWTDLDTEMEPFDRHRSSPSG